MRLGDVYAEFFPELDRPGARLVFLAPFLRSVFFKIVSVDVQGLHPEKELLERSNFENSKSEVNVIEVVMRTRQSMGAYMHVALLELALGELE